MAKIFPVLALLLLLVGCDRLDRMLQDNGTHLA